MERRPILNCVCTLIQPYLQQAPSIDDEAFPMEEFGQGEAKARVAARNKDRSLTDLKGTNKSRC